MVVYKTELGNIEAGEFLTWVVTTQAYNEIHVELIDISKSASQPRWIFDGRRKDTNIGVLSQGSELLPTSSTKKLILRVTIPDSDDIKVFVNETTLTSPDGESVGHVYTICGEDAKDLDYNDFCLNIVGWKVRG